MKTFVLAFFWWSSIDHITMSIVKANSAEEVLKKFILEQYEEDPDEYTWGPLSIEDCLNDMEVTCSVIEVK